MDEKTRGRGVILGVLGAATFCGTGMIGDSGSTGSNCSETIVDIESGTDTCSKPPRLAIGVCARDPGGEGNLASLSSITMGSYCELMSLYVDVEIGLMA